MIPNMKHVVDQMILEYPEAFAHCHMKDDPRAHEFIILLAKRLNTIDKRFGLNGRRGSTHPSALSWDALNFTGYGGGTDQFGRLCSVIDVVGGAGAKPPYTDTNPAPRSTWSVFSNPPEANGAWIDPTTFSLDVAIPDTRPPASGPALLPYEALGGDATGMAISRVMAFDYERAHGKLDKGCGAWMFRSCWVLMSRQEGIDTADKVIAKYRPEWCKELRVPVIPVPADY